MRALRVVGVTGDGAVVLEDPGRRERYTVPADEQLRAAARGDVTRLGQIAIELESQLRPREIQARIRGGASVTQVAEAAGVPVQKIERFAYPVLLERSRTAELAQGAHPQRADGPDIRTLGETVAHTFGLRGQDYTEADWDSWKGDDGKWIVALSWRAGRSDNAAHWAFQPGAHGGTVAALDEHASDLVEGLPARPLRTVGPVIEIGRDEEPEPTEPETPPQARAAVAGETRGGDARRRIAPEQRRSSPAAPPPWSTPAASTTAPVEPPEPAGTAQAAPEPAPIEEPPEVEPAAPEPAPAAPVAEEPAVTEQPAEVAEEQEQAPAANTERDRPSGDDAPAEEQAPEEPEKPARSGGNRGAAANRRTKKGKPVMPSWDEVLLGVRGQR
jgi:hypothetical protein